MAGKDGSAKSTRKVKIAVKKVVKVAAKKTKVVSKKANSKKSNEDSKLSMNDASKKTTKNLPKKKIFVLDTSVVVHDPYSIFKFEEHDVCLIMMLFTELDGLKNKNDSTAPVVREFIRTIDEVLNGKDPNGGVSLGNGLGKLLVKVKTPDFHADLKNSLRSEVGDDHFLNAAYCIQSESPEIEVILVTKDINLRLRAAGLGIKAQDFLSERVENVDFLSEEVKTIDVPHDVIDGLYESKSINPSFNFVIDKAYQNQNFILRSNSKSAIVRYAKNSVFLVKKDKVYTFDIKPQNSEQAFAMEAVLNPEIKLVTMQGPAGTGKTLNALAGALHLLRSSLKAKGDKGFNKILFTRKIVSTGEDLGYLPGDAQDKMDPYMGALYDNLDYLSSLNEKNAEFIKESLSKHILKIESVGYIRGRSIRNSIIIIDESQNLTPHDVKTILSRAGEGTKIIFLGDIEQIDVKNLDKWSNGLSHLIDRVRDKEICCHIRLFKGVRSELADLANLL